MPDAAVPARYEPRYDWDAIELDWRAGILTPVAMAQKHGVSVARIRAMAERLGWKKVELPSTPEVIEHAAAAGIIPENEHTFTDEEVRKAQLMTMAAVVECHRADISRLRTMSMTWAERLERRINGADPGGETLGGRESIADGLLKLSKIVVAIVQLERQSFGLESYDSDRPGAGLDSDNAMKKVLEIAERVEAAAAAKAQSISAQDQVKTPNITKADGKRLN